MLPVAEPVSSCNAEAWFHAFDKVRVEIMIGAVVRQRNSDYFFEELAIMFEEGFALALVPECGIGRT
jgi:hypothetical protein